MIASGGHKIVGDDCVSVLERLGDAAKKLARKRILIAGASGFLPSYLADTIACWNDHADPGSRARLVLLVRRPVGDRDRLAHLVGRSDTEFVVQDVVQDLSARGRFDLIVHAASPASPRWYRKDPVGTIDANSRGLRNLLELAKHHEGASLLYFSSSEVYGTPEPQNVPTPETYVGRTDPTDERACYVESKRLGETMCRAYFRQYGVAAKIARPFHFFGPGLRMDDGRLIPELLRCGLTEEPFELLSDGQATRTYGYVAEATIASLLILLSDMNGEVFNVGVDSPELSVLEVATLVAGMFGRTEPVRTNLGLPVADLRGAPSRACPDIAKLRKAFGYKPVITLEKGLERTIEWFRCTLRETR